ncbi:MAG: hypothetical protein AB7T49_20170 [Oligoflexales bacterium]
MHEKKCRKNLLTVPFTVCPACLRADHLHQISFDVFCLECGWNSASVFVESGGFDALIYAYETKLQRQSQQASAVQRKLEEKQKHNKWRAV